MFPPSSGKLSVFRTNPLGRAGTAAEPGRGQGEKRGPPGAAPAAHLVEEGAVRHGDAQPAGAHAQHHVVRGVVAVAPALAAEQPPDGFSAEDHPAGGRAGALEPLEPLLLGWLTPPSRAVPFTVTPPRRSRPWGRAPSSLHSAATPLGDAGRAHAPAALSASASGMRLETGPSSAPAPHETGKTSAQTRAPRTDARDQL